MNKTFEIAIGSLSSCLGSVPGENYTYISCSFYIRSASVSSRPPFQGKCPEFITRQIDFFQFRHDHVRIMAFALFTKISKGEKLQLHIHKYYTSLKAKNAFCDSLKHKQQNKYQTIEEKDENKNSNVSSVENKGVNIVTDRHTDSATGRCQGARPLFDYVHLHLDLCVLFRIQCQWFCRLLK